MEPLIGIVTVSDTRTAETDASGPAAEKALREAGFTRFTTRLVPDEAMTIQAVLRELSASCSAVFTTGGTGFGPRDVTPEATLPLLDRLAPNLSELMRLKGLEETPMAHLSRGVCGVCGHCLIVNLPGSPKAAASGIRALAPLLKSILSQIDGGACGEH